MECTCGATHFAVNVMNKQTATDADEKLGHQGFDKQQLFLWANLSYKIVAPEKNSIA